MATCTTCTRPTDLRLCNGCLEQLKTELRALTPHWETRQGKRELIPGLAGELATTLTRQARIGERNGPRSTETPLPYHSGASVDLETLRDGLWMWATAIAGARGIDVDAEKEPVALARWLLRWAGEIARHEDAAELHGDILSMTKAARRTIDLAPDRRFLGPCDECGEDLHIWTSGSGKLPDTVHCANPDCDATYPMRERRVWLLERAYNQLLTAAEMSRAIAELIPGQPLTPNRISQWASRGLRGRKLTPYLPHPRDPHKRTRFLVEEVIQFSRRAMGVDDDAETA